jgi:superfamily I DNA/RNA helicase
LEQSTLKDVLTHREWLIANNYITFGQQIRLVAENLDVIEIDHAHIMVDEFQDVDQMQLDIIIHLAKYPGVLSTVVVGDRNQSIYGWRGALADPFGMLADAFPLEGEAANTMVSELSLSKNFRSYEPILQFAEKIAPVGMHGVRGDGFESVTMLAPGQSRSWILNPGVDIPLNDRIILCRTNADCYRWQLALSKDGIPTWVSGKGAFWNLGHVKIAKRARTEGKDFNATLESSAWKRFAQTKRYVDDEDYAQECRDDARWVLGLTTDDMTLLEKCMQDERRGLKISTIHKTKGQEYPMVLVNKVDGRLRRETEVYYVACTRAENYLGVDVVPARWDDNEMARRIREEGAVIWDPIQ